MSLIWNLDFDIWIFMLIAIDASRLEPLQRTGVEYYSYFLIQQLKLIIPAQYRVVLYSRADVTSALTGLPAHWQNKVLKWPFKYLWSQIRLAAALWHDKPDLCFIPSHVVPLVAPGKLVATIHDISWFQDPESYRLRSRWYLRLGDWIAARRAAAVLTISEFSRRQILAHYPSLKNKIFVTYLGPTVAENMVNKVERDDYVVILGRVERKKNIQIVLDAWERLGQDNKDFSTQLYLIGKLGLGSKDILKRLDGGSLKNKVRWLGWLEQAEVAKYLSRAKGLFLPGQGEGFGIPVLDAWQTDTPVAAAQSGALPEVVGQAGLLVPNNVDAWVAAIKELCYNDKLRKQLIELSRARRSQFSWDKCAGETWQVFKLILESPEKNITNSELDDD